EKIGKRNKILIIGLDGASPDLIERWMDDLPNLKKIKENGVFGSLNSTIPPFSCPAWNCFMTGKNPGKIGIFDFQVGLGQFDVSSYPAIVNLTYQDSLSFWDIISDVGLKVGIINVPLTYPPTELNGFMVSGFLTPPDATDYTYPEELRDEIYRFIPNYEPTEFVEMTAPELMRRREEGFLDANSLCIENTSRISDYLLRNKRWDVFVTVFTPLDRLQHYFWHHMDENHPKYDESQAQKYRNVIKDFYQKLDGIIGELEGKLDEETNIIIMSDHGFGPAYGYFHINNFLRESGFLSVEKPGRIKVLSNYILKGSKHLLRFIAKLGILELPFIKGAILGEKSWIRKLTPKNIKLEHPYMRSRSFLDIDWKNTKAYAFGNNKIFINLKGRESKGIIEEGDEYEKIVRELKNALYGVRSPLTGKPLFAKIYEKKEIYKGKHTKEAPDLVVMGKEISFKMGTGKGEVFEIPGLQSGDHRQEGLIMMKGPDIKGGKRISADILDIAPTVLYMEGIAIPSDIDGRVLKEVLNIDYEIEYQEPISREKDVHKYSEEENIELQKRLKGLGYM
ncbi:alkaline phosphatase family protein, partial [candidate division WOR-3 bacterium]|nr:alkaline phosphatase family protein [candidate division WOR-3 bacterium]